MNCEQFAALLPRYPDDLCDEAEREAFLQHAAACPDCAALLAAQEALLASLHALDEDVVAPEAFSSGWRQAVRAQKKASRPAWYARWQSWAAAAAAVVLVVGGTALMRAGLLFGDMSSPNAVYMSGSVDAQYAYEADMAPAGSAPMSDAYGAGAYDEADAEMEMSAADDVATERRAILLRTASVTLESTQYDTDVSRIDALLASAGGWVEYQNAYGEPLADNPEAGRSAYMRLRVPQTALDGFLDDLRGIGTVKHVETTAEDISGSYYDTQGRLAMYIAQRDRLTELMAQAGDMADIIEIVERLSDVQYTIETLTAQLNSWDARAQNAVVTVSIDEVAPEGTHARMPLGQRVSEGFSGSLLSLRAFLADMLVFLVMALPYLAAGVVLVAACVGLRHLIKKRKHKENER